MHETRTCLDAKNSCTAPFRDCILVDVGKKAFYIFGVVFYQAIFPSCFSVNFVKEKNALKLISGNIL